MPTERTRGAARGKRHERIRLHLAGTRARPLCSHAAITTLRQCATRLAARSASSLTSLRCDDTGRTSVTPSSVAFCRIRSIFSPRAMACSSTMRNGDSCAAATGCPTCARSRRLPSEATRAG